MDANDAWLRNKISRSRNEYCPLGSKLNAMVSMSRKINEFGVNSTFSQKSTRLLGSERGKDRKISWTWIPLLKVYTLVWINLSNMGISSNIARGSGRKPSGRTVGMGSLQCIHIFHPLKTTHVPHTRSNQFWEPQGEMEGGGRLGEFSSQK